MTSRNFKQSMVNQDQEIIFEVVKESGSWVFPAASSIVEASKGKNMYLRLTDDGKSDIFRLDYVKDGESAGETVFGFVGNGGMDLVELTATTDGTGATTGSWDYEPGEGPAGEAIGNLGHPLQWKGPATVAQLNAGITGIRPGWTYTLTDAGTLTDGSIDVEKNDEVAWTEDGKWFKVGGDGGIKILYGSSNPGGTTYPDAKDVVNAVEHGKEVVIFWNESGNLYVYRLEYMFGYAASGDDKYVFRCIEDYNQTKILTQVEGTYTWSWEMDNKIPYPSSIAAQYSDQSTYTEGDYCMYHGQLYVCTTAISTPEIWNPNHWTRTDMDAELQRVESLSKVAVFYVDYILGQKVYPNPDEILDAIDSGKFVVIDQPNIALPGNHTEWLLEYSSRGAQDTIKFINGSNTLIAARDNTEEEPTWQWETGYAVGIANFGDKTDADLVEGVLTILGGNSLTKLTLTTAQTLAVKANSDVPNFALEIDNTSNSNDVTVTVKDSTGTTTLKASAAGGDTVGAGKYVQLTCVGSCWTLAEFTIPTP